MVLEEALSIESILADNFTEGINNLLANCLLLSVGLTATISGNGASHADGSVKVLLETLGGEDLIDSIRELSPLDMLALLGGLVVLAEHLELRLRDGHLRHGETDAELSSSDVS